MTRKEAIDALKKHISPYTNCAADAEANEVIGMAIKVLEQEPCWIPVTERLPESNGVYIVTREFNDGFECADLTDACYFDGTNTWHNDNRINHGREYVDKKIKAWMPLPEPYKAESEGKE